MTLSFQPTTDGLRAHLDEGDWASVVAAAAPTGTSHGALSPLADPSGVEADRQLVDAARLALGDAPVHLEVVTGAGDRGVVAQVGCDAVATGVVARVLVTAGDGSGPAAVPGVEVGLNETSHVVPEVMRLFPGGGLVRHDDAVDVTMPHELALTMHRALSTGDTRLAGLVAEQAGLDGPPEVLVSLARGTSASATITARVAGSPTTVVQQWLLGDIGWVLLTVQGALVTHTVQSRHEVGDAIVRLVSGAFAAAADSSSRSGGEPASGSGDAGG